jgi:hypothetical protein
VKSSSSLAHFDQRQPLLQPGDQPMSAPYAPPPYSPPQHVVVTDIHIPFWRLVGIFVKWALAAIPATIVLMIIFMVIGVVIVLIAGLAGVNLQNIQVPR